MIIDYYYSNFIGDESQISILCIHNNNILLCIRFAITETFPGRRKYFILIRLISKHYI